MIQTAISHDDPTDTFVRELSQLPILYFKFQNCQNMKDGGLNFRVFILKESKRGGQTVSE